MSTPGADTCADADPSVDLNPNIDLVADPDPDVGLLMEGRWSRWGRWGKGSSDTGWSFPPGFRTTLVRLEDMGIPSLL